MSQEYNFKIVKKELSRSSTLDWMKNDVLDVLASSDWYQNMKRRTHESFFNQGETEIRNDPHSMDQVQTIPQLQNCKWDETASNLIKLETITESQKDVIFKKWEERISKK